VRCTQATLVRAAAAGGYLGTPGSDIVA